jgi:(1->4)-alpha-D-glucan 1-alpha-D-glucosylmutase
VSIASPPRATYRLQLNRDFPFTAAAELAPYLERLGISHVYLSPILAARRGSAHGYDTVDHARINPELGGLDDFRAMATRFRHHGLGIILDIVPNHMGVGGDQNTQWLDVLEWGERSRYASWFDINWRPSEPTLQGRLLAPFLGTSFAEALADGTLALRVDRDTGELAVWIGSDHKHPLSLASYPQVTDPVPGLGDLSSRLSRLAEGAADYSAAAVLKSQLTQRSRDEGVWQGLSARVAEINGQPGRSLLAGLIASQNWRLARYSVASDDVNYRRFFIVSDLAAIRIERDDVFDHAHALVFALVGEGLVQGLRIDHIDGLYDPKAYCLRLRETCPAIHYLVAEKILAPQEALRRDWALDGTTGYEFSAAVTGLLVDPLGEGPLDAAYRAFSGEHRALAAIEKEARLSVLDYEMAAELDSLAYRFRALASTIADSSDLTHNALRQALRHFVAALPVYRTYIDDGDLADADRRAISVAIAEVRRAAPLLDPAVADFIHRVVTAELCRTDRRYDPEQVRDLARRVQQLTGPVTAKGLEDTALYRYNRLIALSDVGSNPDRFARSVAAFHDLNRARAKTFPHGMISTSRHDTKRGEDARARIAGLSGVAEPWGEAVPGWHDMILGAGASAIDRNDAWYFFQLLIGAWPAEWRHHPAAGELAALRDRLDAAMLKSIREARTHTSWNVPKPAYERAVASYVAAALASDAFLADFCAFERRLAPWGAHNSLIEAALKLTVPGLPDIYQGAEFFDQSLVDPDNRRPVDFAARVAALDATLPPHACDGRAKQRLIVELLALRRRRPDLFALGSYQTIAAADDLVVFLRRHDGADLLVAAQLFPWRSRPGGPRRLPLGAAPAPGPWSLSVGAAHVDGRTLVADFAAFR